MKFTSILTILLIFTIAAVYAVPLEKRKLGSNVSTQGVRFKDLYAKLNAKVKKVEKVYDTSIASFDSDIAAAAKKDGTEVPEFLTSWNKKYKKLNTNYVATSKAMSEKIAKLDKFLKENS
uniref:V-type ATP synthase alpha chain 2 n=1 Tax=Anthurium amnicola TaxID=1678845 RepID=A0A1D1Z465_9ARAE